ncbi:hypothetical protein [Pseudomonas psychrophila]|uniref:Uncharacterized protein n=1 Tax=Pseudomonas psychrophila TaxID=122355 RepID=A0A8I1FVY2_9PSED|nr:hypothetical protein [Pseudomonas psychrophila]AVX93237.1 hypothetical protein PkP19E3_34435 [Pseudomonas koreensis]MBJ2259212.1 hypothetical protein [Pseudomonas psychrophila]
MNNSKNDSMNEMRHALAKIGIFAMPVTTRLCAHGYKLHRMEAVHALALTERFDRKLFATVKSRKIRLIRSHSGTPDVWTIPDMELLVRIDNAVCIPELNSQLPTRTRIQDLGDGLLSVEGFWRDAGEDRILLTRCPIAANVTSRAWLAA